MKSQKKRKYYTKYSDEQEKEIYDKILNADGPNPGGSSNAKWDKSFVIDVGDGDKIRVWEVNGKLTYPHSDQRFVDNKLYRKKFAKAVKKYKPSDRKKRNEEKRMVIEKTKSADGRDFYRKNNSYYSGEL
jgi:hypothetical protein